jgi:hypothetical protein
MPVADSPSPETLDGLSTVLGGCSGGTLASTLLTIADFSPMSRGSAPSRVPAGRLSATLVPARRYARRQPALRRPVCDMARNSPGAKTAPLMPEAQCKSGTNSGGAVAERRDPAYRTPPNTAWPAFIQ